MNNCPKCNEPCNFDKEFKCYNCDEKFWQNMAAYEKHLKKLSDREHQSKQEPNANKYQSRGFTKKSSSLRSFLPLGVIAAIVLVSSIYFGIENATIGGKCNLELKKIGDHIVEIGEYKGSVTDSYGKTISGYLFKNSDVNLELLDNAYSMIDGYYKAFKTDLENNKEFTPSEEQAIFNCYKSAIFFVYPEKIERAGVNEKYYTVKKYDEYIRNLDTDKWFTSMLNKNTDQEGITDYEKYKSLIQKIDEYEDYLSLIEEVTNNEKKINQYNDELDTYERIEDIDSYNNLIPIYNSLLKEYGENFDELEQTYSTESEESLQTEWYYSFISLVQVNLILPDQDKIDLAKEEKDDE